MTDGKRPYNSTYKKLAHLYSADPTSLRCGRACIIVVNKTLVLRNNIFSENRYLLVAAKRNAQTITLFQKAGENKNDNQHYQQVTT